MRAKLNSGGRRDFKMKEKRLEGGHWAGRTPGEDAVGASVWNGQLWKEWSVLEPRAGALP